MFNPSLNQSSSTQPLSIQQAIDEFKEQVSQVSGYENPADYISSVNLILENLQYKLGVSSNLTLANLAFFPLKETSEGNYNIDQEKTLNSTQKTFLENSLLKLIQGNHDAIQGGIITSPDGDKYALGNMIKLPRIDGKPVVNFGIVSGDSEVYQDGVSQFSADQSAFALKAFEEVSGSDCGHIDLSRLNPQEARIIKDSVDECLDRFVIDASLRLDSQNSSSSLRKISLLKFNEIADSLNQTVSEFSSSSLALSLSSKSDKCNITDFFAIEDFPKSDNQSYGDLQVVKSQDDILKEFSKKFLDGFARTKEISQFISELNSKGIDASIIDGNQSMSRKLNQGKIFVFDNMLSVIQADLNKKTNLSSNVDCDTIYSRDLVELCVAPINSSSIATDACVTDNATVNIEPSQTSFAEVYLSSPQNISEVNETLVDANPESVNPDETAILDHKSDASYSLSEFENKILKNFLIEVPPAFFSAIFKTSLSYNNVFRALSPEEQNFILSAGDQSARLGSLFYFSDNIEKSLIGLGSAQLANGLFKIAKVNKTSKSFINSTQQLALKNSYIASIKKSYDSLPSALHEGIRGFAFVALYQSIIQGITTSRDDEETYKSRVANAVAITAITAVATGLMRGFLKIVTQQFENKNKKVAVEDVSGELVTEYSVRTPKKSNQTLEAPANLEKVLATPNPDPQESSSDLTEMTPRKLDLYSIPQETDLQRNPQEATPPKVDSPSDSSLDDNSSGDKERNDELSQRTENSQSSSSRKHKVEAIAEESILVIPQEAESILAIPQEADLQRNPQEATPPKVVSPSDSSLDDNSSGDKERNDELSQRTENSQSSSSRKHKVEAIAEESILVIPQEAESILAIPQEADLQRNPQEATPSKADSPGDSYLGDSSLGDNSSGDKERNDELSQNKQTPSGDIEAYKGVSYEAAKKVQEALKGFQQSKR